MNQKAPKSKLSLAGGILGGALLLGGMGFFCWRALAPQAPKLPLDTYLTNARGLAGNHYEVQVRIERQLDNRTGAGRIILARDTTSGRPVPFLDGGKAQAFNPEPGQLYSLTVQVAMDGLLELTAAKKL